MIQDIIISYPKQIPDNRGTVRHFITTDTIKDFAECYTTTVYKGIIKGWHGYYTKTLYYCVPIGLIKLVLYDYRKESSTYQEIQEIYLGPENYTRVTIPPGVLSAFQGVGEPLSLVVLVANEIFDEQKTMRFPIENDFIPYDWTKINK